MPDLAPAEFDLLEVTGADAMTFLQAQLASDLRDLAPKQGQFSAWLNPQGRVIAFFPVFRLAETSYVLALAFGRGNEIRERLSRFVFRSKVKLVIRADLHLARSDLVPEAALASMALPEQASGTLWLGPGPSGPEQLRAPGVAEIKLGLPFLDAARSEQFIGHALGLKRLQAIHIGKGCYPGQEIVARTHFLGRNKRALCLLTDLAQDQTESRFLDAETGQAVGDLVIAADGVGLAVLHEPRPGQALTAPNGRTAHLETVFADS